MKSEYIKTRWVDNKTPVNAANLNKIESGLNELFLGALGKDELVEGDGIEITTNKNGEKVIGISDNVQTSNTCTGIEFVSTIPSTPERNKIYMILDPSTRMLSRIMINGVTIFRNNNE